MQPKTLIRLVLVMVMCLLLVPQIAAQEATAVTSDVLNVRSGPGTGYQRLGEFARGTTVVLEGRDAAYNWVLVRLPDNSLRGWVASGFLILGGGVLLENLPVSGEVIGAAAPAQPAAPAAPVTTGEPTGSNRNALNVRAAAGTNNDLIGQLPANTTFIIEGRNTRGDWLLVRTADNSLRGWVYAPYVRLGAGVVINNLAVVDAPVTTPANNNQPAPADFIPPASANGTTDAMMARLNATPFLYNFSTAQVRQAYQRGQSLGNNKNVFVKVGDSITANQAFLSGFGPGGSYALGPYGDLQGTIDFFSAPVPSSGANSFAHTSMAAFSGSNAAAVLDRLWSDTARGCDPTIESPLECEYRVSKPAVAIIMLGSVDIQIYSLEQYTGYIRQIIRVSLQKGVIPVLTTFTIPPDYQYWEKSLRFNMVLLDLARQNGIPLINFWRSAYSLPDYGVGPDRYHLSQGDNAHVFSNGEERTWGLSARNLMSLQALDQLRRNVLR